MVAWLTMRADRIIRLMAANKSLLLSDPVSVSSMEWMNACVLACLFTNVCVSQCVCVYDPRVTCFPKRKWNLLCFPPPPQWAISFYYFTCTSSRPCCNQRAKSLLDRRVEWRLILNRPQKRQQLSAIETFTFIFLKKKWMWMRPKRNGEKKVSIEGSRPTLLKRKKDLDVRCLKWRRRAKI